MSLVIVGVIHAVSACLTSWSLWKKNDGIDDADDDDDVVYTHYVIVNDTQEALRIGQAGTSESVLILPRHIHQYAWKCIGDNNQLHVCMEGSRYIYFARASSRIPFRIA